MEYTDDIADFTFGVRLALVFIIQSAFLSAVAVVLLLAYVAINGIVTVLYPPVGASSWQFFRSPVDWYFIFLLICDLIQALGSIMNAKWVEIATLRKGAYCTAQGMIKQFGDTGVALGTLAIAVHTFSVLFLKWNVPATRLLPISVIGIFVLFLSLSIAIPYAVHRDPPIYGPSHNWCWMTRSYTRFKVGLEYGIFWFVAAVNILLYVPLFFVLRGNIKVAFDNPERGSGATRGRIRVIWKSIPKEKAWTKSKKNQSRAATVARQMLVYPVAYVIIILPLSIIRWISFSRGSVPAPWIGFAGSVFGLSGLVNVILYTVTRPSLLPKWRRGQSHQGDSEGQKPGYSGESSGGRKPVMPEVTMMSFSSHQNDEEAGKNSGIPHSQVESVGGMDTFGTVPHHLRNQSSTSDIVKHTPMLTDDDDDSDDDGFPQVRNAPNITLNGSRYLAAPGQSPPPALNRQARSDYSSQSRDGHYSTWAPSFRS